MNTQLHGEIAALFDLSGSVAVVTGGASKLGLDAASVLAAAGADVAVTSRDARKAQDSARQIEERYGVKALGLALDHTEIASVTAAAEAVTDWSDGRVDILVNNGGGGSGHSKARLFERDPADIDSLIRANLIGPIYCCREFGKRMAERGSGRIINIASIAAHVGRDRSVYDRNGLKGQPVDYAASKAGILGLTRDLAAYLAPQGVRVNAISPGGFERSDMPEGFVADYSRLTALGRMGRDGIDLKGAILFLASDASNYVTGQEIIVDGGFTIWR
ncbi:SDR family NAD(P)-dependent oxidoreductase [Microvirga pudoricolor]|uniref:SDR family NAD(P)-dependent oxidoreductase n=1 Tax=Microvirga pudoricolor TaxID=2778729 RepID=UPI00194EEC8D|nr:SDR family oxidoreductase [Microvirga pudoricolor]MBM6593634.1 SDR family oxidoreductase [Microvirga pudoricolor]